MERVTGKTFCKRFPLASVTPQSSSSAPQPHLRGRLEVVKIVELIPFTEANEELLEEWKQNVEECYWLYAPETDYFAKAEYEDETSYFVRTEDGGWFSMGWFGSRLDIDGSLYEKMKEYYNVEE